MDPLGLFGSEIAMPDGGGSSKSTTTPIVNTEPKKDIVKEVKKEVVKKETSGASDWGCKVANKGTGNDNSIIKEDGSIDWNKVIYANESFEFGELKGPVKDYVERLLRSNRKDLDLLDQIIYDCIVIPQDENGNEIMRGTVTLFRGGNSFTIKQN